MLYVDCGSCIYLYMYTHIMIHLKVPTCVTQTTCKMERNLIIIHVHVHNGYRVN